MVKFIATLSLVALCAGGSLAQTPSPVPTNVNGTADIATTSTGIAHNGFGTCGSENNGAACPNSTHCCSKHGFCGVGLDEFNQLDYCGDGCQGGPCTSGFKQLGLIANASTTVASNTTVPALTNTTTLTTPAPSRPTTGVVTAPTASDGSIASSSVIIACAGVVASFARFD